MGVKERSKPEKKAAEKEKERTKPSSEELESPKPTEVHDTESVSQSIEQESPSVIVEQEHEDTSKEVVQTVPIMLPKWGDMEQSEWMYHIPIREQDIKSWSVEWSDFLLEWLREKRMHTVTLTTFIEDPPFKEIMDKSTAFSLIAMALIERNLAEWIGRGKRQLRVYWRSLEEWSVVLYQWALSTGTLRLDVKSMVIQEPNKEIAGIPEIELHKIMEIMVRDDLAEWVDRRRGAIKIYI